ncbi:MAG: hypothetical protein Q8O49_01175, partial [bacterium]|nr:hypothetical protein [bacterium]
MKILLLSLGVILALSIGFLSGRIFERFESSAAVEISLSPIITSVITVDVNKDGTDDFVFSDGVNVKAVLSNTDGKFVIATILGTAFDEMAGNLEIIVMLENDVFSVPVDE